MGLAASQARYLALTARKDDLEYQSQIINTRRMQLAYKTADVARAYSEGMNNKIIAISSALTDKTDGQTTTKWNEITFANIQKGGFMLIGTAGTGLDPAPYIQKVTGSEHRLSGNSNTITLTKEDYDKLTQVDLDYAVASVEEKDGEYIVTLKSSISSDIFDNGVTSSTGATCKLSEIIKGNYSTDTTDVKSWVVNPDYVENSGIDIQTLLVSAKAQIVTQEFFNFLFSKGYNYEDGMPGNTPSEKAQAYAKALEEWENDCTMNPRNVIDSVVPWNNTDTAERFKQRYYTEDDADVLAKYEADTAEIQAQDKMLEMKRKI